MQRIMSQSEGMIGKTFLINLLLAKIRSQTKIALVVASSGIAATLLNGGRTAHSTFKLPLNLVHYDTPICNIKKVSGIATVFEKCHLIVWDECTMSQESICGNRQISTRHPKQQQPIWRCSSGHRRRL